MAKDNGGIIGILNTPTQSSAKGVWALEDQFNARVSNIWPGTPYTADFLVIAGGGSGGGSNTTISGGGGNGGEGEFGSGGGGSGAIDGGSGRLGGDGGNGIVFITAF